MIESLRREPVHRYVYLFALALLVCCLPLSKYLLSISQFLLAVNWILEGRFRHRALLLKKNPEILLIPSIFLVYAFGLLFTGNTLTGLTKIKNVLPLLLLPLVTGSSHPLSKREFKGLLLLYVASVVAAVLVCVINYLLDPAIADGDFRRISIFMQHSRFSLLVLMAVFILLYMVFYDYFATHRRLKTFFLIIALALTGFLFFLRSFTGMVLLILLGTLFILRTTYLSNSRMTRMIALLIVVLFYGALIVFMVHPVLKYFHPELVDVSTLEKTTASGHPYTHDPSSGILENGYYADLYVCEPELRTGWNGISKIPYDSTDRKGQQISYTLKRYLTSKNLRKDSAGLRHLGKADITAIENGLANYRFREKPGLSQRLYEIIWEIHVFHKTGFVSYHSVGQRIVFFRTAMQVIRKNFPWGTGTGDVYDAMLKEADANKISLSRNWEGKPHNQYLFLIIAFGVPGFLWILFAWIYPVVKTKCYKNLLFNIFAAIIVVSMLANDTLESYEGIVFFSFYYCLFAFGLQPAKNKNLAG
jgi:hypothetical protein